MKAVILTFFASIAAAQRVCNGAYELHDDMTTAGTAAGKMAANPNPCTNGGAAFAASYNFAGSPKTLKAYPHASMTHGKGVALTSIQAINAVMNWDWLQSGTTEALTGIKIISGHQYILVVLSTRGTTAPGTLLGSVVLGNRNWWLYRQGDSFSFVNGQVSPSAKTFHTDLMIFVRYIRTGYGLPLEGTLDAVQGGTEIMYGQGGFLLLHFSAVTVHFHKISQERKMMLVSLMLQVSACTASLVRQHRHARGLTLESSLGQPIELSKQWAKQTLCDRYQFQNDLYRSDRAISGTQTGKVYPCNAKQQAVWSTTWSWEGGKAGIPKSYSNVALVDNMGKPLSSYTTLQTEWSWQYTNATEDVAADIAYDLFLASGMSGTDQGIADETSKLELMIWLSQRGGVQPIGHKTGDVTLLDNDFQIWQGNQTMGGNSWPVVSFVNVGSEHYDDFKGDVMPFFDWIEQTGGLDRTLNLASFQGGVEPVNGTATLLTTAFSASAV
ncbi:glycoside hydrolase family 12 protein [Mixia osmundae IAM 14324]|uniref:Uncharacterized protein n=1 Tax=Mixia osmundae (strain CBS 9802 / IAM 14324 / JCM 22182 / KY 12970) TaxID=764103 RepID=G7DZ68_MIXOS|nr:glycoside hydrolase family 12 protein [Mixia osmundae IAM 14324]KEI38279.1 glycoside hydrolase family 12 protein [Mixia osmundae IAM 14324]GAA95878.1 hypothetical protein E5Q_02535 [Mixia osmundae IAM 14324]